MKTADFLPPKVFEAHLDRRKTPRRVSILLAFAIICVGAAGAVEWETRQQETRAVDVSRPNPEALAAKAGLEGLYRDMTFYSLRLDPLAEHLRMPTAGEILAGLAEQAGRNTEVEKIVWKHDEIFELGKTPRTALLMRVTATVQGDRMVLSLPKLLEDFTEYAMEPARTVKTQVIADRPGSMRVEVELWGKLLLPTYLNQDSR